MKKVLFIVLALAAVACNKTEVVEQNSHAIGFDGPFIENSTKATDLTSSTLADFGVYGYVQEIGGIIFNNEKVTKSGSTWTYSNTQYWVKDKPYYFTAIAPASQGAKYTPTAVDAGTIQFDNTTADIDLLHAYEAVAAKSSVSTQPDPVKFTFNHLLSRVKFSFVNEMVASNATIIISNVKIVDAFKTGKATITDGALESWVPESSTNTVVFDGITDPIAINAEGETAHMYFIPEDATYAIEHTLQFDVLLMQGTVTVAQKSHEVTLPKIEIRPGLSYDFKATLNSSNVVEELFPITFTAEATPWVDYGETVVPDSNL